MSKVKTSIRIIWGFDFKLIFRLKGLLKKKFLCLYGGKGSFFNGKTTLTTFARFENEIDELKILGTNYGITTNLQGLIWTLSLKINLIYISS